MKEDNCAFCFGVPKVKDDMLRHALKCESHPLKEAVAACQNVVDTIDKASRGVADEKTPIEVLRSMPFEDFVDMYNHCQAVLQLVALS